MTLRELQRRINALCAENPERLDMPIIFRLHRGKGGNSSWHIPLTHMWSGLINNDGTKYACELIGLEADALKPTRRVKITE